MVSFNIPNDRMSLGAKVPVNHLSPKIYSIKLRKPEAFGRACGDPKSIYSRASSDVVNVAH